MKQNKNFQLLKINRVVHEKNMNKPDEEKDPRYASFIASTSGVDRHGDVVDQNSWHLENFKISPVILFNHNQFMLPIGKGTRIDVVNGELQLDIEFDLEDELGAKIARKVQKGFLNGVSVGFIPKQVTLRSELPEDHFAHGERGLYLQSNELLEVSVVTIAANPKAAAKFYEGQADEQEIKRLVQDAVKTELLSRNVGDLQRIKHILEVEETADTYIVTFAKIPEQEEEPEEGEEVEESAKEPEEEKNYLLNYLFGE